MSQLNIPNEWKVKKQWPPVYSPDAQRLKEEYIPIHLAYEKFPFTKPPVVEKRLKEIENIVPVEERNEWLEESKDYPKRGEKAQYDNEASRKYYSKRILKGDYPIALTPFTRIKSQNPPTTNEWYLEHHPELRGIPTDTVAKKLLNILDSHLTMRYSDLMFQAGYGQGDMNYDIVLRRLENSGLIMRPEKGKYRITLKGKEAIQELRTKPFYKPFGEL